MAKANVATKQDVKKGTQVAVQPEAKLPTGFVTGTEIPDYLKNQMEGSRGSENVGTEDLVIPRLEVLQALSPQLDSSAAEFVKGAAQGDLVNSVTGQKYGREVFAVPVQYEKLYLVWVDRAKGGGFRGAFKTAEEAQGKADSEGGAQAGLAIIDTPTHLCLLAVPGKDAAEEIMIAMPRTKAKISRQWNSMIKLAGGDRFTRAYRIATQAEKNAKGTFWNFVVTQVGFPRPGLYKQAEALYNAVKAGKTRSMDSTGFNPRAEPGEGEEM